MEKQKTPCSFARRKALDKWIIMAKSPAHKWGQIIGDFLESSFEKELTKFARKQKLFLDKKGKRKVRKGLKVSWVDGYGNSHDLDFVLERNGSANKIGEPVAFIEIAWRRYTKHSRNKAQEIQGAILPLVTTHKNCAPFIGVVLGGEFTNGAIRQLDSLGFHVLYFPYEAIVKGFSKFGIDAGFEENTTTSEFENKIKSWDSFTEKDQLSKHLLRINSVNVRTFFDKLEKAVSRYIESVKVLILHGNSFSTDNIAQAVRYIESYVNSDSVPIVKYEIFITYSNGDKIEGAFIGMDEALTFLNSYTISIS